LLIQSNEVSESIILRAAKEADFPAIKELIHAVQINPMGLDWRRFLVAIDPKGEIIGCGQIKPHQDGSHELASIAVVPDWRGRGVARKIIESLTASHADELYLTCRERLGPFYEKFGFIALEDNDMPPYFRRIRRITRWMSALHLFQEGLLVMKKPGATDMH
jgi:N-acetylglutamate synthase-like GNAT family acetyltransferase